MQRLLTICLIALLPAALSAGTITYQSTGVLGGTGPAVGETMTFTATFDDTATFVNGSGYRSVQADSIDVQVTGGHTAGFTAPLWLVIAPWDNSVRFAASATSGVMFSIFHVDGNIANGGGGTGSGLVPSVPAIGDTVNASHLPSFLPFSSFNSTGNYSYTFDNGASTTFVPEPSTYALMFLGLIGLGVYRRKKAK